MCNTHRTSCYASFYKTCLLSYRKGERQAHQRCWVVERSLRLLPSICFQRSEKMSLSHFQSIFLFGMFPLHKYLYISSCFCWINLRRVGWNILRAFKSFLSGMLMSTKKRAEMKSWHWATLKHVPLVYWITKWQVAICGS